MRVSPVAMAAVMVLAASAASAQQLPLKRPAKPTKPAITAEDLMSRLYVYSDDSLAGRASGMPAHDKATGIIAAWAKGMGLKPMGDSGTYFQSVPLQRRAWEVTPVTVGGTTFAYGKDFGVFSQWAITPFDGADILYGGLVGDTSVHLTAELTKGKVVVFGFTPDVAARGLQAQFMAALSRPVGGAAAVVLPILDDAPAMVRGFLMKNESITPSGGGAGPRGLPPVIVASNAMVQALAGGPLASVKWGTATGRYTGKVSLKESPTSARNVVAMIEGSDPVLKHQYVAIGAHNDHIGVQSAAVDHDSLRAYNVAVQRAKDEAGGKPPTPAQLAAIKVNVDSIRIIRRARLDSISNGADDDGSGTVATAEVAEAFAAGKAKPKRSILFVWHMGEEIGLVGSDWYTKHPTVPLDSIVAQLNMDMVGRGAASDLKGGGPAYLQLVGSRRLSTELGDLVESINKQQKAPFTFDYQFDAAGHPENIYCRSDHANYARFGIPVTFFTTGLHADYHQVTDEAQYIDYPHMAAVSQLVYDVALGVANADHRMVVDKAKPNPNAACKQ